MHNKLTEKFNINTFIFISINLEFLLIFFILCYKIIYIFCFSCFAGRFGALPVHSGTWQRKSSIKCEEVSIVSYFGILKHFDSQISKPSVGQIMNGGFRKILSWRLQRLSVLQRDEKTIGRDVFLRCVFLSGQEFSYCTMEKKSFNMSDLNQLSVRCELIKG